MIFLLSKAFFKQLTIVVLGFLVLVFALKFWLHTLTHHGQKIEVPDLTHKSLSEVRSVLQDVHLDFIVIDSASFDPVIPKKSVVEQHPEAGDFVKEKRKIYLTLNPSKYRSVRVPNVLGNTKRQAITQLRSVGFVVGKHFLFVQDLGKNVVRGLQHKNKRIQPNDKLPLNSVIQLILGNGRGN